MGWRRKERRRACRRVYWTKLSVPYPASLLRRLLLFESSRYVSAHTHNQAKLINRSPSSKAFLLSLDCPQDSSLYICRFMCRSVTGRPWPGFVYPCSNEYRIPTGTVSSSDICKVFLSMTNSFPIAPRKYLNLDCLGKACHEMLQISSQSLTPDHVSGKNDLEFNKGKEQMSSLTQKAIADELHTYCASDC
jgi:hypothetical protein